MDLIGYPAPQVKANRFQMMDGCSASENLLIRSFQQVLLPQTPQGQKKSLDPLLERSAINTTTISSKMTSSFSSCGCLESLQTKAVDWTRFVLAPPTDCVGEFDR